MDHDLIARVQHGDPHAFENLALADHSRLFRVAYGILRDRTLADDATQQALLTIWQDIRRLREPAKYEAWAYRVLVHTCKREAKRRPDWIPDSQIPAVTDPRWGGEMASIIDRDQLERGFQRLSIEHRAVVVLRYLVDLTPDEVAAVLGIPRRTVYSRLKRALPAMRAALEADDRIVTRGRPEEEPLR